MICILQVRSSSRRLRNKAFLIINEKKIIENVIDRLLLSKNLKKIIIATSSDSSDQKFEKFINKKKNILIFRGPLNNVFKRYLKIIDKHQLKYFLRINGDSPTIDYRLIDRAYKIFKKNRHDIVTNVFKRSFPQG